MLGGNLLEEVRRAEDGQCDKCDKVTLHLKHYTSDRRLYRTECLECGVVEYYA